MTASPRKTPEKPERQHHRFTPLAAALWAATAAYIFLLLLSPPGWLPGEPIWAIRPETVQEILAESLNFFFVLPLLSGFTGIDAPVVHPAMEAFFNIAEAWIFMFLPLMRLDPKGQHLPRTAIWGAALFLTNVFLMPYMALRQESSAVPKLPRWVGQAFGAVGLTVGTGAIAWLVWARPEFGGLGDRAAYFLQQVRSNRVTLAFCVDLLLFWLFQAWLMGAVLTPKTRRRWLRFIPFWGLGIGLLTLPRQGVSPEV